MSIKRSGGSRAKVIVIASIISTGVTNLSMSEIDRVATIESESRVAYASELALRKEYRLLREKEEETYKRMSDDFSNKVKEEQEEAERMKNYRYRRTKELKQATGLDVVGFEERDITITFYGDGAEENGGYAGITCTGAKLVDGMVASNVYPLGTKILIEGKVYTVSDRGGSHFNSLNRLDVFTPKRSGESKQEYDRRILKNGRKTVSATVIKTK